MPAEYTKHPESPNPDRDTRAVHYRRDDESTIAICGADIHSATFGQWTESPMAATCRECGVILIAGSMANSPYLEWSSVQPKRPAQRSTRPRCFQRYAAKLFRSSRIASSKE